MADQPILFVGRVADVGENNVVVGHTRIELRVGQALNDLQVGFSVTLMAEVVDGGRFVGGRLIVPLR